MDLFAKFNVVFGSRTDDGGERVVQFFISIERDKRRFERTLLCSTAFQFALTLGFKRFFVTLECFYIFHALTHFLNGVRVVLTAT